MRRLSLLTVLVWFPFVSIFFFAAQGDTSAWHLAFHAVSLLSLGAAWRVLGQVRSEAGGASRPFRILTRILAVSVPLAVLGHVLELLTAVVRLAEDGWVNRDTADLWERGPHLWASNLTIPAMLVSLVVVLALVVATALRRRPG